MFAVVTEVDEVGAQLVLRPGTGRLWTIGSDSYGRLWTNGTFGLAA